MYSYVLIGASVLAIAIGQVIFKYVAVNITIAPTQSCLSFLSANSHVLGLATGAVALYAIATVAWIVALRTVPLSVAYLFNAMAFVVVPLAAILMFGESPPRLFYLGATLIVGGLVLVAIG